MEAVKVRTYESHSYLQIFLGESVKLIDCAFAEERFNRRKQDECIELEAEGII
jgi:hypothetical protein